MVERFDPPRDLDWKPLPMRPDIAGQYVRYSDLAEARAEIERLNNALIEAANQISDLATRLGQAEGRLDASELVGVVEGWKARAEKAEAERDLARAWVAKAFRMAMNETAKGPGFIDRIRELTPADAQAALEAYGREKVREGMQRAAGLYPQGIAAILAAMEKEGGE